MIILLIILSLYEGSAAEEKKGGVGGGLGRITAVWMRFAWLHGLDCMYDMYHAKLHKVLKELADASRKSVS